jgi:hypothetical protein
MKAYACIYIYTSMLIDICISVWIYIYICQITINCMERGLLLLRVGDEVRSHVNAYTHINMNVCICIYKHLCYLYMKLCVYIYN